MNLGFLCFRRNQMIRIYFSQYLKRSKEIRGIINIYMWRYLENCYICLSRRLCSIYYSYQTDLSLWKALGPSSTPWYQIWYYTTILTTCILHNKFLKLLFLTSFVRILLKISTQFSSVVNHNNQNEKDMRTFLKFLINHWLIKMKRTFRFVSQRTRIISYRNVVISHWHNTLSHMSCHIIYLSIVLWFHCLFLLCTYFSLFLKSTSSCRITRPRTTTTTTKTTTTARDA